MHAQMLHEVIMPAKIFATGRVRASMSYMCKKTGEYMRFKEREIGEKPHVSHKYVYS